MQDRIVMFYFWIPFNSSYYIYATSKHDLQIRITINLFKTNENLSHFALLVGKTRTKDKYRVVYTDFQRLELEKEYCTSRYITIRRKSELAQSLSLSERQVKIWFQNRRAKERKQNKKGSDPNVMGSVQHTDYSQLLDAKTKLEPGLHLQHPLHSMNPMAAMNIPAMRLHPHLAAHSHSLAAAAAHSHQLQHSAQMSAAAVGVGTLSMWHDYGGEAATSYGNNSGSTAGVGVAGVDSSYMLEQHPQQQLEGSAGFATCPSDLAVDMA